MNNNPSTEADKFDEYSQFISDFTDTTPDSDVAESLDFMQAKLSQRPDDWRAHLAVAQIITRNFTRHGITRDVFDEAGAHVEAAMKALPGTLYKLKNLLNKSSVSDEQAASTLRDAVQNVSELLDKYTNLWKEYSESEEELYRKPLREGLTTHEHELSADKAELAEVETKISELSVSFEELNKQLDALNDTSNKFGIFKWLWILLLIGAIAGFSFKLPILGAAAILLAILSIVPYFIAKSKVSKFKQGEFAEIEHKLNDLEAERSHLNSDIEFHQNWISGKREYL